jgi:hypothetical protein
MLLKFMSYGEIKMGSFSDYAEDKVLDLIVGKTAFTLPTVWIALCTADPTDAGTGASMSEVANTANYSRKSTVGGDWNAASGGSIDNANAITFATASGSWGTITHFVLIDSASYGAGNILAHGTLTASKTVGDGDAIVFAAGNIVATLD